MLPDENRINQVLGDHFRRARETLGWTLRDVSDRVAKEGGQVSISALSRFERGQVSFSFLDVIALSRAIGTPVAYLEEVIRAAAQASDPELAGMSLDDLMREGRSLALMGYTARATSYFERALDILSQARPEDTQSRADTLIWLGEAHRREGRLLLCDQAAAAVVNMRSITDATRLTALVQRLAVGYLSGDFAKATLFAEKIRGTLNSKEIEIPPRGRAHALGTLASMHERQSQFALAIPLAATARDIYRELQDTHNSIRMEANLGYYIGMAAEPSRGLHYVNRACEMAVEGGFIELASHAFGCRGSLHRKLDALDKARDDYSKAADYGRRAGRHDNVFLSWYAVWQIEQEAGNRDKAEKIEAILCRLLKKVAVPLPEADAFIMHRTAVSPRERSAQ